MGHGSLQSTCIRILLAFIVLAFALVPAQATMLTANIFFNELYSQTGSGTSFAGDFFSANGTMASPTDYSTIDLFYPGPGVIVPFDINGTTFSYQTGVFTNTALFQADYPAGSYDFVGDGATQASINYSQNLYDTTVPALTAASFNALQHLDPTLSHTINFNSFTPGTGTNQAFTFFTIFDSTGATVFQASFLSNLTTSVFLPANTLAPGSQYTYDLDFSNRLTGTSNGVATVQGFEVRTDGNITTTGTAVPEPSALGLFSLGMVIIAAWRGKASRVITP